MQNFVLMEMLAAGDKRLLKAEVEKILAKPAAKPLGLIKQMAAPLLVSLGREKLVEEEIAERSGKASYLLTEQREAGIGKRRPAPGGRLQPLRRNDQRVASPCGRGRARGYGC